MTSVKSLKQQGPDKRRVAGALCIFLRASRRRHEKRPEHLAYRCRTSANGPKLLKYEPGEKMMMTVSLQDDVVRARLYDEFTTGDDEATDIEIQWPQKFSRTFTERAAVEALLADYLQFQ